MAETLAFKGLVSWFGFFEPQFAIPRLAAEKTNVRDWNVLKEGLKKFLYKRTKERQTKIGHIMTHLQTICPWTCYEYCKSWPYVIFTSSSSAETHLFASHFSHLSSFRTFGFLTWQGVEWTNPAPCPEMMAGGNLYKQAFFSVAFNFDSDLCLSFFGSHNKSEQAWWSCIR